MILGTIQLLVDFMRKLRHASLFMLAEQMPIVLT